MVQKFLSGYHWLASFRKIYIVLGAIGLIVSVGAFIVRPSFPTPDKILVLIVFGGMIFSQAKQVLVRFVPFVALLYLYEAFRGVADGLNTRVNYTFMIDADRFMFGGQLPTVTLQQWFWNGSVQWYDFVLYLAYMAHFVIPLGLALVVWKKVPKHYWRLIASYIVLSFAGFITYLLFPAAPPWMASDLDLIEPITRISSDVWYALGVQDFATFYSKVSPNAVAAVPSLHSAYALLFALLATTLFKNPLRYLAWIYPVLILFGTVYQGEHYAVDAFIGWAYAIVAFVVCKRYTPGVEVRVRTQYIRLLNMFKKRLRA